MPSKPPSGAGSGSDSGPLPSAPSPTQAVPIPGAGARSSLRGSSLGKKRPLTPSTPDHGLLRTYQVAHQAHSSPFSPPKALSALTDSPQLASSPGPAFLLPDPLLPIEPTIPIPFLSAVPEAEELEEKALPSALEEESSGEMMLACAYITNALAERAAGRSAQYDDLIAQISQRDPAHEAAEGARRKLRWIRALGQSVSALNRDCHRLIHAVLELDWLAQHSSWFREYLRFLELLVSAHAFYVSPIIRLFVQPFPSAPSLPRAHLGLRRILRLIPTASTGPLASALTELFPHKRQRQEDQLTYLRNVLTCVRYAPGVRDQMMHVIVERILQVDVAIQVGVEELEEMEEEEKEREGAQADSDSESDPESDPESAADSEEEEEEEENDSEDEATEQSEEAHLRGVHARSAPGGGDEVVDDDDDEEDEEDALTSVILNGEIRDSLVKIRELTNKLDAMLSLVLQFLKEEQLQAGSEVGFQAIAGQQFTLLLEIFDRLILVTFKSRYTQFLLFWAASRDTTLFPDLFLSHLISLATGNAPSPPGAHPARASRPALSSTPVRNTSAMTRVVAASYAASFASRAAYVSRSAVRSMVSIFITWAARYLTQCEQLEKAGRLQLSLDEGRHAVFYALVQAVMYTFCFRWRDLLAEGCGEMEMELDDAAHPASSLDDPLGTSGSGGMDQWMPILASFPRLLLSRLNPLRVCSQGVGAQFAQIARRTNFMYCYTILERNKSVYIPKVVSAASAGEGRAGAPEDARRQSYKELDSFFPFDPCRLPLSSAFFADIYNEWAAEEDDSDEEVTSADEDEEDDDKSPSGSPVPLPSHATLVNLIPSKRR